MSGSNLPAPDEKRVSTEENSVVKWLNNVVEPFEQVDEEAPPIPTRNPLRLLIRREPTYDELEVSPGSDGMDTEAKLWHKHDSDPEPEKKQDDKNPRVEVADQRRKI
ncbi:hypothetical protein PFICI_09948 [Pestalotiopsis fici W106-1]|uniref:Uncharacterized protein n=1 Tax=Pestalotiopsis fici (strain W106-1 / CGMCC3.15140) TaxID=1229662 RepID=W3WYC2_PESFW|nr:uncharacterized protein PFICI_09948 [Pestalotiopsis fici W106-1]ETS77886.1 hypothetical protein PFICI_09948 [Pestalotiopsis fici W106-1]